MNDLAAMNISSSGMAAQRARIKIISENLANIQTTGPDGPYQRQTTILQSNPIKPAFESDLESAYADQLTSEELEVLHTVSVGSIRPDGQPPIKRYEPSHPYADKDGYVAYPNISIVQEMADLMEASRSYEANLAVSKSVRDMINQAIDVLK